MVIRCVQNGRSFYLWAALKLLLWKLRDLGKLCEQLTTGGV